MRIECPICGIKGFLEIRGRSARVKHYTGIRNNKRIYTIHKIPEDMLPRLIPSDYQNMLGIKTSETTLKLKERLNFKRCRSGPVVQWYECRPRTAEVAGSNPARSTFLVKNS